MAARWVRVIICLKELAESYAVLEQRVRKRAVAEHKTRFSRFCGKPTADCIHRLHLCERLSPVLNGLQI